MGLVRIVGCLVLCMAAAANARVMPSEPGKRQKAAEATSPLLETILAAPSPSGSFGKAAAEQRVAQLHEAAATGTSATVAELLAGGTPPDAAMDDSGITPLMHAADGEIAGALIRAGARVDSRDASGWTPLHFAATRAKSVGVVRALLDAGADARAVNGRRETPLHLSRLLFIEKIDPENGAEVVRLLVERGGAAIDARDADGRTVLHAAAENDNAPLATVCLKYGADPNARTADGKTAGELAKALGSKKVLAVFEKHPRSESGGTK